MFNLLQALQSDRPVRRELVGIQEHFALGVQRLLIVNDVLVLQASVVRVEVARSMLCRASEFLVFPEICQALVDVLPGGTFFKKRLGDGVVRIDKLLCLIRIGILQPAIRVSNLQEPCVTKNSKVISICRQTSVPKNVSLITSRRATG